MTYLIEFLRARLGEDEATAQVAGGGTWCGVSMRDEGGATREQANHVLRWDPARVLAEVEAKRRILARHTEKVGANVTPGTCAECGGSDWRVANAVTGRLDPYPWVMPWPCPTIRILAQPYADHPDFDHAWLMPAPTS